MDSANEKGNMRCTTPHDDADRRFFPLPVLRTFEESVQRYFVDPVDDDHIAAITRVWEKLRAAGE